MLLRQACEAAKIASVREDGAGFVETGHEGGQRSRALAAVSWTAKVLASARPDFTAAGLALSARPTATEFLEELKRI